jgi:hypothetical protein
MPARAIAAAAARRLDGAAQEPALPRLRGSGQALRQAAGHGPLADHADVQSVDLRGNKGRGADAADAQLTKVRRKYKEYGINEKPFVIVKSDVGSYGRGVMTVRDAKDIEGLARRCPRTWARKSSCRRACPRTSACTTPWPSRWST